MMPFSCAASSASAICFAIVSASSTGTAPSRLMRSASVSPGHQLHHQIARAVGLLQSIDRGDVRMIQRSQHLRFALKTGEPFGIVRERFRQNLDGHVAPELGVVRLIHFAHAARTDLREDFVGAELGAGREVIS